MAARSLVYSAELNFTMPNVSPGRCLLILQADFWDNIFETAKTSQYLSVPIQIRVPDLVPVKVVALTEATPCTREGMIIKMRIFEPAGAAT